MSTASAVVPVGYKQTEVGVIPEDWGVVSLVDIVDSSRSIRYGIVQPGKYDMHGRYMIRGQDYSLVNGWASPEELFRVTPEVEIPYKNARVKTGDLIMTIVGYCGHVEEIPEWLDGANLTQTTARIAILPRKADSRFCKYVIQSEIGVKQVGYFIKGAAQPGLNCGDVEKFRIPLPSVHEQRKISHQIFTIDQFIGVIQELIEKKRYIKQGTTQELLTGKTRLPGFTEDWEVKQLNHLCSDIKRGASPRPIANPKWFDNNSQIGWVRISDATSAKRYLLETKQKLSREGVRRSRYIPKGNLIMSICATVGRPIQTQIDVCIHDGFVIFEKIFTDQNFLYYVLCDLEPRWSDKGQTGSQMNLNTELIKSTEIFLPSDLSEQEAIAEVLSDMDAEIAALEERLEKAKAIKQGMMQQLLTGKIRLID
jgi:type I restriction enzyme S subunit